MRRFRMLGIGLAGLGMAGTAQAQDIFHEHADGRLVKGGTACVGPLAATDAAGVNIVGATTGADLTWQVWSTSSQTAPALVFESVGTSVDALVPPSGNLLYYACVDRGPKTGQEFDLTLFSGTTGVPAEPAVEQQRSFGTIVRGMFVCTDDLAPTGTDGVQIFGFTNGFAPLTWRVVSVDELGVNTTEFSRSNTFVDHTVPLVPDLVYHACVLKGPAGGEDYDLSLNSTTIE